MKYFLLHVLLLTNLLEAQKFSTLKPSRDTYLNFTKEQKSQAFIDESHALAWEPKAHSFKNPHDAVEHCNKLKLDGFTWHLPSLYQVKTLHTKKARLLLDTHPLWDQTLWTLYDVFLKRVVFSGQLRKVKARCVSEL